MCVGGGWKSRQNPPFSCPHPHRKHLFPCGEQDQLAVLMQGFKSSWFLLEKEFMVGKRIPQNKQENRSGRISWCYNTALGLGRYKTCLEKVN